MRIVDTHMHCWTRVPQWRGAETPERAYGHVMLDGKLTPMMPPAFIDGTSPPDVAIAYMDRYGVERAVRVQELIEGFINGCVADCVAQYPDRLLGEAGLDQADADATAELDALLAAGRLQGMKLPIASQRRIDPEFDLDHPRCMEWLEVCAARGAFVTIHPLPPAQSAEPMRAAAERFEQITFIIAHMGLPNRPGWHTVLDLCRLPNVAMDISAVPFLFKEPFPCPQSQDVLQRAVQAVGADRFLWGSDYPRTLTDLTYGQMIDWVRTGCPDLSDDEKSLILGGNALRLCWKDAP